MKKLAIIGIDSLDPLLIDKFRRRLPNIDALIGERPCPRVTSVFPPDSIPAWMSIFTGKHPANHGIIHSFDVFQEDWANILAIDPESFKDEIFWNIISSRGYKVCVLFPELCFPPWPVNGILVSRSLQNQVRSYPESVLTEEDKSNLGGFSGLHPGKRRLAEYYLNAYRKTEQECDFSLRVSAEHEWDLFFHFIAWLDIVCHFFWRYMDDQDPRHPGKNPFSEYIPRYYELLDSFIGRFRSIHPDTPLLILSDHGHGMRPPKTVNVNVMLRREGFQGSRRISRLIRNELQEFLKRAILEAIQELELDDWMLSLSRKGPLATISKDLYLSKSLMDGTDTARLSSFAGPKTYSHGGIDIVRDDLSRDEYESVRETIITLLSAHRIDQSGNPLFKKVARREEVVRGTQLHKYPDILFELSEGFGVYWATGGPLIGKSYEHNLSSGGHKMEGVLISEGLELRTSTNLYSESIVDISPTVLDFFGVFQENPSDGRSLLAPRKERDSPKEG